MTEINIIYNDEGDESNRESKKDDKEVKRNEEEVEIRSGFGLLLQAFKKHPLLWGKDPLPRYGRKLLKLSVLSMALIFITTAIVFFVYDVGYNTSVYPLQLKKELPAAGSEQQLDAQPDPETVSDDNAANSGFLKYLKEHEQEDGSIGKVLTFFLERKHSFLIYLGMIVLLISFNVTTYKRIHYLWLSYFYQYQIQTRIVNNEETKMIELEALAEQPSVNICTRFVATLYNSFNLENSKSLFPQFFKDFYTVEEEKLDAFNDNVNRSAVWIVRLGIFGTLLGVAVAFFELFIAIKGVTFGKNGPVLEPTFLEQLNQALLGNALAVATSLVAHASTLVIEIGIAFFLKDEHNLDWLNRTYGHLLQFKGFSSSVKTADQQLAAVNANMEKFSETITIVSNKLSDLAFSSEKTETNLKQIQTSLTDFDQSLSTSQTIFTNFHDSLDNAQSSMENFADHSRNIQKASIDISNSYQDLNEKTHTLSSEIEAMSTLLGRSFDVFLKTTSKSFETAKKGLDSLMKLRK